MHKFSERDIDNNGHTWNAVYDALGRRWQVKTVPITNNVEYSSQTKIFQQAYDPLYEFLEVGVFADGRWQWKVHGPDLSGSYGTLNGLGGWEAVVGGPNSSPTSYHPLLADIKGNILGAHDPELHQVQWSTARTTAYGAIPGHRPLSIGEGVSLWESGAWRGKHPELSGIYNLGCRYYTGGSFLSPDPFGHLGSISLYDLADGNPNDYFDTDGRIAKANAIPAMEFGIAPIMSQRTETTYHWMNGTSTGPTTAPQLYAPESLGGRSYTTVTEKTGNYFLYSGPVGAGSSLSDGYMTRTPITKYEVDQRDRVAFLGMTATAVMYADGAGALIEGLGLKALLGSASRTTATLGERSFSIVNWGSLPEHLRPAGPLTLLETGSQELLTAQRAKATANDALRETLDLRGLPMDIHEIQPVKFGGSPIDLANKTLVPRSVHQQVVTPFWNQLQRDIGPYTIPGK